MDPESIGKVAEASAEIAKTTSKGIDAAVGAGRFAKLVFGDLIVDAVGLLGDRLKFYRLERWHRLAASTEKRLLESGVEVRPVPPKVAIPLIEHATLEDDDNLQDMWAELLATAMTDGEQDIEKKFVSVLAELSLEDAMVLRRLYDDWINRRPEKLTHSGTVAYGRGIEGTHAYGTIAVITLARLGLITPTYVEFQTYEPPGHNRYGDYGPFSDTVRAYGDLAFVEFTDFGIAFCEAVLPSKPIQ